ncbi:MAG: methyltransferase [bacterium]
MDKMAYLNQIFNLALQKKEIVIPLFVGLIIYLILPRTGKKWVQNYLIPISFFSFIFLRTLFLTIMSLKGGVHLSYVGIIVLINKSLLIIFMGITIFSYIIRLSPDHSAKGIWEKYYPTFVFALHIMGAHFISVYTKINVVPIFFVIGLTLCFFGLILDITSLWHLRKSFSITVEVRKLVNKGPYKYVRHPLYTGEVIYWLGLTLLFNNRIIYVFFIVILITQISRALLEEHKLFKHVDEYCTYKQATGFILPKVNFFRF